MGAVEWREAHPPWQASTRAWGSRARSLGAVPVVSQGQSCPHLLSLSVPQFFFSVKRADDLCPGQCRARHEAATALWSLHQAPSEVVLTWRGVRVLALHCTHGSGRAAAAAEPHFTDKRTRPLSRSLLTSHPILCWHPHSSSQACKWPGAGLPAAPEGESLGGCLGLPRAFVLSPSWISGSRFSVSPAQGPGQPVARG